MDNAQIYSLIENFLATHKRPLLVLVGPTASGKTALSIEVAKKYNGEIISTDSRQVYIGMDIGTDKIPLEKREGVPHHLIDVVNPDVRFTVADFKKLAEEKIEEIYARGHVPMLVGGTGLYIRVLTDNFAIPPDSPEVRKRLNAELEEHGREYMHKKLQEVDPESAAKIHMNNIPYLIRALEIFEVTGTPKSAQKNAPKYNVLKIGIQRDREELFERINQRVDEQIQKNGLLKETKMLLTKGYSKNLASMKSLGYQEVVQYLEGTLTLEQATELLKQNTRNFAKRQLTWWKREPDILWQKTD